VTAKKCKFCQVSFMPMRSLQQVCSPSCGIALAQLKQSKKVKKECTAIIKERKERLKTHKDYMKELQPIFNKYIRLRDRNEPCICCGAIGDYKWDAGHYLSRGSHPWLAVNEDNVHKQRARPCNSDKSGNQAEYRIRLIEKIGLARVEALENCHDREKLSIEKIKELTKHYKLKVKEMKNA